MRSAQGANVMPRFRPENREANRAFVCGSRRLLKMTHATPAQTVLAWVLAQKSWMVPHPREFGTVAVDKGSGKIDGQIRSIERRPTFRGRMDRCE
jgi:hypothetical protein